MISIMCKGIVSQWDDGRLAVVVRAACLFLHRWFGRQFDAERRGEPQSVISDRRH